MILKLIFIFLKAYSLLSERTEFKKLGPKNLDYEPDYSGSAIRPTMIPIFTLVLVSLKMFGISL